MKVGVFSVILGSLPLEQALDYLASLDVQAVEIGAGAFAGKTHCPVDALLGSERRRRDFLSLFSSRGITISALNCPGNPIHPDKRRAARDDADFRKALRLAPMLGVDTV